VAAAAAASASTIHKAFRDGRRSEAEHRGRKERSFW
jgi:hypothetical protein